MIKSLAPALVALALTGCATVSYIDPMTGLPVQQTALTPDGAQAVGAAVAAGILGAAVMATQPRYGYVPARPVYMVKQRRTKW